MLEFVLKGLRRRAQIAAWFGYSCLVLIAALVAGGAYFVWYAQSIVRTDVSTQSGVIAQKDAAIAEATKSLDDLNAGQRVKLQQLADDAGWRARAVRDHALTGLWFSVDGQHGVAVGNGGTIVTTADGGASWQTRSSGTANSLFALQLTAEGQRGVAVGEGGAIVTTADGGANWQTRGSGTQNSLRALQLSAEGQRGVAVGADGVRVALNWQPVQEILVVRDAAALAAVLKRLGVSPEDVAEHLKEYDAAEAERAKLQTSIDQQKREREFMIRAQNQEGNWTQVFSNPYFGSFSIRVIVSTFLFFFISLLVSVYRYSMRLSAFYDARADALALSGGRPDGGFHRLVISLSPQGVDFGKTPTNPMDRLWDALETLARNVRK